VLLLVTFPMEVLAALTVVFVGLIPFSIRSHRLYLRRDLERTRANAADKMPLAS